MKRAKLASPTNPKSILSLVATKGYNNIDRFYEDVQLAIQSAKEQPGSSSKLDTILSLEEEVASILTSEIEHSILPIPRSDAGDTLLRSSSKADSSLETDASLVLTAPGFVYGSSHASKRLYSSFRLSSTNGENDLHALQLDKLPNNITATFTKLERNDEPQETALILKDVFQNSKVNRLDPPRHSSSSAKGPNITWSKQGEQKKVLNPKERQSYYNQNLITGQWLSYNVQPSMSQMPFVEARRKRRDRALSTGEVNIDLTEQEKETIHKSQRIYQQAKTDSLFKCLYSSFAPTHDNTGAVISKELRSQYWWIKLGATRYLSSSTIEGATPFDAQYVAEDNTPENEESDVQDNPFDGMLESWIDPELLETFPKEKDDVDKDTEEILTEVSEMLQMLSSYQRNRTLALNHHKQQGSSTQNKSLVELLGDPITPSSSELILYDTLRSSLTSLITSLPPYAVAKLDGEQMGQLNISTKLLVHEPIVRGTNTGVESQTLIPQSATRAQQSITARIPPTQQISTPTPNLARPSGGIYVKYRQTPGMTGLQGYGSQPQVTPRISYAAQTPSTVPTPLLNGTRSTMNGHTSHGSQRSPQRPLTGSASRSLGTILTNQAYSNHNVSAVSANAARSASPQNNHNAAVSQAQRANWNPSNGTIGSMFSAEEVSRLEERQKAQMAAQAAQIRQDSGTPRPSSQAISPISTGTPGE